MAEIVLGIGTSHTPSISMGAHWWPVHAAHFDPQLSGFPDFEERCRNAPDWLRAEIEPAVMERKHQAATAAIERLSEELKASRVDAIVVIGDDQLEVFPAESMPALALFAGETLVDLPSDFETLPESWKEADWARHSKVRTEWPASRELGLQLVLALTERGFDVCQVTRQPADRSLGHAFTFVNLRLMRGAQPLPLVPVFLNTYYPPNQLPAARCWLLGGALREGIRAWENDARIAVVASGGLSHFVIDAELDRSVLRALAEHDGERLGAIPESKLQSGSSEIKNWIVAGGALADLEMTLLEYIPTYRSGAGTGVGLAFALWR